jgi:hypothetical protein
MLVSKSDILNNLGGKIEISAFTYTGGNNKGLFQMPRDCPFPNPTYVGSSWAQARGRRRRHVVAILIIVHSSLDQPLSHDQLTDPPHHLD